MILFDEFSYRWIANTTISQSQVGATMIHQSQSRNPNSLAVTMARAVKNVVARIIRAASRWL